MYVVFLCGWRSRLAPRICFVAHVSARACPIFCELDTFLGSLCGVLHVQGPSNLIGPLVFSDTTALKSATIIVRLAFALMDPFTATKGKCSEGFNADGPLCSVRVWLQGGPNGNYMNGAVGGELCGAACLFCFLLPRDSSSLFRCFKRPTCLWLMGCSSRSSSWLLGALFLALFSQPCFSVLPTVCFQF